MPRATVTEGGDLYPLPEQMIFDGQLLSCDHVDVPFTYKRGDKAGQKGTFPKWEWTWVVTNSGEYHGVEVKGSTEPKVTDASDTDFLPLARPVIEALLGRPIALGEDVDTDDLLGLPAKFTVTHQKPRERKNGDGFWYNVEVSEVFPASGAPAGVAASASVPQADPWAAVTPGAQVPAGAAGVPAYDEPPF